MCAHVRRESAVRLAVVPHCQLHCRSGREQWPVRAARDFFGISRFTTLGFRRAEKENDRTGQWTHVYIIRTRSWLYSCCDFTHTAT